jgi:glycerophosphoryl diester phosphodiesterase
MMTWRLSALVLLVVIGCASPDSTSEQSDSHYRSFASAEELRSYLAWSPNRTPLVAAHRGGPLPGFPENCIETFENALSYAPCLIECDVRRTADSVLILMHDEELDRTTTGSGRVDEHTLAEIQALRLLDNDGKRTGYVVPTLAEALAWARERAILELDIKRPVSFEEVIDAVREVDAAACVVVIAYDIESAVRFHRLAPDLMISGPAGGEDAVERLLASSIPPENLLGWVGVYEPPPAIYEALHERGIRAIIGTIGNLDRRAEARGARVYAQLLAAGADILATDNVPLAAQVLD